MRGYFEKVINSRFGVYVNKFFHSSLYILLMAAICAFCHEKDLIMIGTAVFTVFLIFSFVFCKDLFVLVPFVVLCTFAISNNTLPNTGFYSSTARKAALILELIAAFAALVFNLTYYKRWRVLFRRSYLTVSLSLVTAVLLMGGIGSDTFTASGAITAAGLAATMCLPYALFLNCGEYDGKNTLRFIAWTSVAAAAVFGYQVLSAYAENMPAIMQNPKPYLHFGCFISNSGAAYILTAIPLTFYLMYSYKYGFALYPVVIAEVYIIMLTYSRASIVVAFPLAILLAVVLMFLRRRGRVAYCITTGIVFAALIAFLIVFGKYFLEQYKLFSDDGIMDSGRFKIWKLGFESWKSHPLFGLSMWFLRGEGYEYYSFHCTPLTYLFCCGTAGLAAYLYHRYKTVRLMFCGKLTVERVFTAVAVLAIIFNALLDVGLSFPMHLIVYSLLLAVMEHDVIKYKKTSGLIGFDKK